MGIRACSADPGPMCAGWIFCRFYFLKELCRKAWPVFPGILGRGERSERLFLSLEVPPGRWQRGRSAQWAAWCQLRHTLGGGAWVAVYWGCRPGLGDETAKRSKTPHRPRLGDGGGQLPGSWTSPVSQDTLGPARSQPRVICGDLWAPQLSDSRTASVQR